MKKILLGMLLALAVSVPAFAHHSHIGIILQAPGVSIGYHNGWRGHDRFDLRVYPARPSYPVYPYQPTPAYQYPRYIYRQVPSYCFDYYGNAYICGYHLELVPTY